VYFSAVGNKLRHGPFRRPLRGTADAIAAWIGFAVLIIGTAVRIGASGSGVAVALQVAGIVILAAVLIRDYLHRRKV
jgi:hypothetical protein